MARAKLRLLAMLAQKRKEMKAMKHDDSKQTKLLAGTLKKFHSSILGTCKDCRNSKIIIFIEEYINQPF